MSFKNNENGFLDLMKHMPVDEIDELPEFDLEMDEIENLPEIDDDGDEIDSLPDMDDEDAAEKIKTENMTGLFKSVDRIFKENSSGPLHVENINSKVKELIRYCSPTEMIKTGAYYSLMRLSLGANLMYHVTDHYSQVRLDDTIIGDVKDIYNYAVTPRFIRENFGNTVLNPEYVASEMTDITCKAAEAVCYIGGKAVLGVSDVVEDAVAFGVGMISSIAKHPELAEKVYKSDITGAISAYIDEIYDGPEIVKEIGACAQKVGEAGTYIGLAVLSASSAPIAAVLATAGLGAARAGETTRRAVEKTGEFTYKEMTSGIVSGVVAVVSVKLTETIHTGMKTIVAPKLSELAGQIKGGPGYLLGKLTGFAEAGAVSGMDAFIYEGQDIIHKYIEYGLDIENEIDVNWKQVAEKAGVGALVGGGLFLVSDISKDISRLVSERMELRSMWDKYLAFLKKNSEFPDTINMDKLKLKDLYKRSPEETKQLRMEFNRYKERYIEEWEKIHGHKWPVYEKDLLNEFGEIVKKKGWKYDAHHIHPLSIGGSNTADNITPFRYDMHSDHKGVHAPGSPYDILEKFLKGGLTG